MSGSRTGTMKGTGNTIGCMGRGRSCGWMGDVMRESMNTTKSTVWGRSTGQMAGSTWGSGRMASSMAEASTTCPMGRKK